MASNPVSRRKFHNIGLQRGFVGSDRCWDDRLSRIFLTLLLHKLSIKNKTI
jgi:hypothetical protein